MKTLPRCLTSFSLLLLLLACRDVAPSTPRAQTVEPTTPRPDAIIQPTMPLLSPTDSSSEIAYTDHGHLSPALHLLTARAAHTATVLPDGRVLIAGGFRSEGTSEVPIASAEIYDPETGTFAPTGPMNEARSTHTATLLPNGQVLIVGGWGSNGRTATAELYDPQTGKFRYALSLAAPRASMTATLLEGGQVLIAGGDSARNTPQLLAEIYHPNTNSFTRNGSLNDGRSAHTATRLPDGNVLFIGGRSDNNRVLASAEIYNPTTGEFVYTGRMRMVRHKHAAVLLQDGRVLVIGGSNQDDWTGKYTSAELYDAATGTFTPIANLNQERFKLADAAVLLNDGNVLVSGGARQIEQYDAQDRRFILDAVLDDAYFYAVSSLLHDGRVLITGGYNASIQPSEKAWIYNP
jgi:hypothetical protein